MKKWKLMLLSFLLIGLVAVGYNYFYDGVWRCIDHLSYNVTRFLDRFLGPLTFAVVISAIIMIKQKNIILPTLSVVFGIILMHVGFMLYTYEINFTPLLVLFDIICKTAFIIIPALIIYGIFCFVKLRGLRGQTFRKRQPYVARFGAFARKSSGENVSK